MRVVIDARWIFREISGIDHCTRELLRYLPRLDASVHYVALFCDDVVMARTSEFAGLEGLPNVTLRKVGYGVFSPRNQLCLGRELKRLRADVYHSPNYMIPLLPFPRGRPGPVRCVVTIHDVIPLLFPDHAPRSRKSRLYPIYRGIMREVGRRADAIVTVSEASRRDVLRTLAIDEQHHAKVRAIHNGVSPRFSGTEQGRADRRRSVGPRRRVILYVGRSDPYKNLPTLVRAFADVRRRRSADTVLVIAGSRDPRYPEAGCLARELGVADAVSWTGYLSDDDLVRTYRQADVLAHPSRYEGFGLQVVEAMACGTPVVCSNRGALPEVAGNAALIIDPDDVQALADALARVLDEPGLAADMARKGLEQAARFSWEGAARAHLGLYRALL